MQLTLAPQADHRSTSCRSRYPCMSLTQRRGDYVWAWTLIEGADS